MKHVGQSSQKHASGSLYIAKYATSFRFAANLRTIFVFPFPDVQKEPVPLCLVLNRGHLEKDFSQLSGIRRFGECPAPGHSLPLNVDKTALDRNTGPELIQNVYHGGVTVYSKAARAQPIPYKTIKEGCELGLGIFRQRVLSSHNLPVLSLHQRSETAGTVKESAVQHKVLASLKFQRGVWRALFQIVINHAIKLCRAMFTLTRQLPDRITLSNPKPEPFSLSCASCRRITPANGLQTGWTIPALLTISVMTVPLQNFGTERAVFFCSN